MSLLFGLAAAICWGSADLLARFSTRIIGTYRTLFFMQVFGFVGLGVYLIATGDLSKLSAHSRWQPWAWAFLFAALNTLSSLALYRSFEVGVLSVVSPIAASYAALTTLLALLTGERITALHGAGIAAALAGVILAAITPDSATDEGDQTKAKRASRLTRGVGWALAAALGYGVLFWLLGFEVVPQLGSIAPIWMARMGTLALLALFARPARQSLKIPRGRVWWCLAGTGVLDTLAYIADAIGLSSGNVAIVTVLASLFSAVTVVLAWMLLRDRLHRSQWLGIAIIFAGVVLVSLP